MRLERVTVAGVAGAGGPGAVHVSAGAAVTIVDSWFEGVSGEAGGAVLADAGAALDVVRTVFCGNSATGPGAGLRSIGATVTVSASAFQANASGQASAIHASGGALTVLHADVVGNLGGSAVVADPGTAVTVESSMLYDNAGTALVAAADAVTRYDLFSANGADVAGGATIGTAAVLLDPELLAWTGAEACGEADLRPGSAASPLLGNGDPASPVANIGEYGGPDAPPGWEDVDGDGDDWLADCDDDDPLVGPSSADVCGDGLDNDCSGVADDDPTQLAGLVEDADGDGFGDPRTPATSCATAVADATDCNDAAARIFPGAVETCDHVDEDCSGVIDDVAVPPEWGPDLDGDGAGTSAEAGCFPSDEGYAPAGDCDDARADVRPGMPEVCDGLDNDCDPATVEVGGTPIEWYADADGDAFGAAGTDPVEVDCADPGDGSVPAPFDTDCDDGAPEVRPGAPELCNGRDDDCDGAEDGDPDLRVAPWYPDADGDGAGDRFGEATLACGAPPAGLVANADDCDDRDPARVGPIEVWPDADGDGWGAPGPAVEACFPPEGYADTDGDCNDGNPGASPGAAEVPGDRVDNDCDGAIDEADEPGGRAPAGADEEGGAGCGCRTGGGGPLLALVVVGLRARRRSARSG